MGYSLTPREMSVEESLRAALRSNKQDHDIYRRQEAFVSGDVFRGYQICGRSQDKEAWDYAEFVVCIELHSMHNFLSYTICPLEH